MKNHQALSFSLTDKQGKEGMWLSTVSIYTEGYQEQPIEEKRNDGIQRQSENQIEVEEGFQGSSIEKKPNDSGDLSLKNYDQLEKTCDQLQASCADIKQKCDLLEKQMQSYLPKFIDSLKSNAAVADKEEGNQNNPTPIKEVYQSREQASLRDEQQKHKSESLSKKVMLKSYQKLAIQNAELRAENERLTRLEAFNDEKDKKIISQLVNMVWQKNKAIQKQKRYIKHLLSFAAPALAEHSSKSKENILSPVNNKPTA